MTAQKEIKACPSCGGHMKRESRETEIKYQGHTLRYIQPGLWCDSCDEAIFEGEDNEIHDVALHEVMARAKNSPISPLLIRAIREVVGISQREAGKLFGGGPTAFYKYETAKSVPSEGMANLLRFALDQPKLFIALKRSKLRLPFSEDIKLIRQASKHDGRLNALTRQIYPEGN